MYSITFFEVNIHTYRLPYVINANGLSYSGEMRNSYLGTTVKFFFYDNHVGVKSFDDSLYSRLFAATMISNSAATPFLDNIYPAYASSRHDSSMRPILVARSRFYEAAPEMGCVYRRSHDETSPILPSRFLRTPVSRLELPSAQCDRD